MSHLQSGPSMLHLHQRLLAYPGGPVPIGQEMIALLHDLIARLAPAVSAAADLRPAPMGRARRQGAAGHTTADGLAAGR